MDKLILDAKNGDQYAIEQILTSHKQLVNSVVRKYFLIGGDIDDLIQEGMIALYNAILTYDKSKNSSCILNLSILSLLILGAYDLPPQ